MDLLLELRTWSLLLAIGSFFLTGVDSVPRVCFMPPFSVMAIYYN